MDIIGKQNEVIDMAKYTVIIEEVVSEEFEIHANTEEEAQKIAADAYNNGENISQGKVHKALGFRSQNQ